MAIRLPCTCGKTLRLSKVPTRGSVRCPACNRPVLVPPTGPQPIPATLASSPTSGERLPAAAIILGVIALLALVGIGTGIYFLLNRTTPQIATADSPGPESTPSNLTHATTLPITVVSGYRPPIEAKPEFSPSITNPAPQPSPGMLAAPQADIIRVEPEQPREGESLTVMVKGHTTSGKPLRLEYRLPPQLQWRPIIDGTLTLTDVKPGLLSLEIQAVDYRDVASTVVRRDLVVQGKPVPVREIGRFLGHTSCAHGVVFTPDGKQFLSGSCDKTVRLWDIESRREVRQFKGANGQVFCIALSPDGRYALTGGGGKDLQLWDISTGELLRTLSGHTSTVLSVAFSPDGLQAASAGYDQTVRLWDVVKSKPLKVLRGHVTPVFSVAFSPDGKQLVSGGGKSDPTTGKPIDCSIRVWDCEKGEEVSCLTGSTHRVTCVSFGATPRQILSSSGLIFSNDKAPVDPRIRSWDLELKKEISSFAGPNEGASAVGVTRDGRFIILAGGDGAMQVLHTAGGESLKRYEGHGDRVVCLGISPDSRYVVTGSRNGSLLLWQMPEELRIALPKLAAPILLEPKLSGQ